MKTPVVEPIGSIHVIDRSGQPDHKPEPLPARFAFASETEALEARLRILWSRTTDMPFGPSAVDLRAAAALRGE